MDWLAYPLGDFLVWTFDTLLVPFGTIDVLGIAGLPNFLFLCLGFIGVAVWMKMQAQYNAEAAANPDQIK